MRIVSDTMNDECCYLLAGFTGIDQAYIMLLLTGFTGIDQAYEAPDNPELIIQTENTGVSINVQECVSVLEKAGIVPRSAVETVEVIVLI